MEIVAVSLQQFTQKFSLKLSGWLSGIVPKQQQRGGVKLP